ncbi:MAG: pilus assembly protein PilF [Burkholderiales bacterium]|nr:MAG: pilus assembly protein PilF [Burkholderiales bacterium]
MRPAAALRAAWHRQLAALCAVLGRWQAVVAHLERALRWLPGDPRVAARLALALAHCGERDAAIGWLERTVALAPVDAASWFNLGYLRQQAADEARALQCFDRALALEETLDRAHYGKALSLIRLGRHEQAIAPLLRNTELQPLSPYGWYQLAHVYARLGRRDALAATARRLAAFEPAVARRLARETGLASSACSASAGRQ